MDKTENISLEEQIKRLKEQQRLAAEQEKLEKKKAKDEEQSEVARWNNFVRAEEVLLETDMKFFRDGVPKYFRQLTTTFEHPKTGVQTVSTEIKFYPPSTLQENWKQLKNPGAKDMFREMVEGGEVTIKDPATGQWVTKVYPPRIFDKITNTLQKVDTQTYNLLNLHDKLQPRELDKKPECSPYMIALISALSGNEIFWDKENQQWTGTKEENRRWLEKWIYGAVHADIGNPTASLPVIFGPGKVGKNALFDVLLKQILGKDACFSSTWDILHGNFDGFKLGKVVMFIDEVPAREDWSAFKNMTGSPDSFVKIKYGAELTVENTIRYAIGCNSETYPLPVEDGKQMMRVSPIKTSKNSTFAENVVKVLDQMNGANFCRELLKALDATQDVECLSDFDVGDSLLRGGLNHDWASREAAQDFLDYLHYTYKSPTGMYSLPPLRGQDWDEVMDDKRNSVNRTVDYVIDQQIQTISGKELYEIYKVFQNERNDIGMKYRNFSTKITNLLAEHNYNYFPQRKIMGDSRETMYSSTAETAFTDYKIDMDRFIIELPYSSSDPGMGKYKTLKYKSEDDLAKEATLRHRMRMLKQMED